MLDTNASIKDEKQNWKMHCFIPLEHEIQVSEPNLKNKSTKFFNGFHVYKVLVILSFGEWNSFNKCKKANEENTLECERRYSDFDYLRKALLKNWPGCYIPPLPPKKNFNHLDGKFVQERLKSLNRFCQEIVKCPHLYNSSRHISIQLIFDVVNRGVLDILDFSVKWFAVSIEESTKGEFVGCCWEI